MRIRPYLKSILFCAAIIPFFSSYTKAENLITLDKPGAVSNTTIAMGISGDNIVGSYIDSTYKLRGFLYNGGPWTNINLPDASSTIPQGISGTTIVGRYGSPSSSGGFSYNGKTWTKLNKPGAWTGTTEAFGIDGTNITGDYEDTSGIRHGFLYNGTTWMNIDKAGADATYAWSINGKNVIGSYYDSAGEHGFIYNLDTQTWTNLNIPGFSSLRPQGISGNNVVGIYWNEAGNWNSFLYDGTNFNSINLPGAVMTSVWGIDGDKIVGEYWNASGQQSHGFIYPIPEPASALLIGAGLFFVRIRRK
jgi:hypothetical protein